MYLEQNNLKLFEEYDWRLVYRFLQAESFDGEKTFKAIAEHKDFLN